MPRMKTVCHDAKLALADMVVKAGGLQPFLESMGFSYDADQHDYENFMNFGSEFFWEYGLVYTLTHGPHEGLFLVEKQL